MGKLWIQTRFETTFWCDILCILTIVTQNYWSHVDVLYIKRLLYYWRCLFSVLELDTRYEWWLTPPNMHHILFRKQFVCVRLYLRHITWKLQVISGCSTYWTTAVLLDTFFVSIRVSWEIQLESYDPRHASSFSGTTLCAYSASMYIHRYFIHYYAWQQNSCKLWLDTTHQTAALLPTKHCFLKAKLATYTTRCRIS